MNNLNKEKFNMNKNNKNNKKNKNKSKLNSKLSSKIKIKHKIIKIRITKNRRKQINK